MSDEKQYEFTRMDVCKRFVSNVPHSAKLGIEVLDAWEGGVRARLPWREDLVGNPETGVIHGGAVFAFLDQVGGLANVCTTFPVFEITPTIDFRVDHLRAPEKDLAVICEAECYRLAQDVTFVRLNAWAEGREDEPVAAGLATYMRMMMKGQVREKGNE